MSRHEPKLDLSAVDFPTDKATIKDLRLRVAKTAGGYSDRLKRAGRIGEGLLILVNAESQLAQWAFDEALGRLVVEPRPEERDEIRETTADEYVYQKLASGVHHAEQLVRDLEKSAAQQALKHLKGHRR